VRIRKSIKLIGEDKNTTIINGTGSQRVVMVDYDTNNVEISGFTIQHGIVSSDWALGIDVSSHVKVYENIVKNTNRGIYINQQHSDIMIYNNLIIENEKAIEAGFNNENAFIEIYNNTISNNQHGFYSIWNNEISFHDNFISNNTVGVYFSLGEENNYFYNNQFINNDIGIKIEDSKSTTIINNNFIKNKNHATLIKKTLLRSMIHVPKYKQNWTQNYWDDLEDLDKKTITGYVILYIVIFWYMYHRS
jgi:parallel beta-helix repeat protein